MYHRELTGTGTYEDDYPQRITVLLVDDHPTVVDALMEIIETDDTLTVVATACRVSEAIRKAQLWQPQVAVLDVNMPEGGGWAVARGLLEVCPEIRLVAYSAFDRALVTRTMSAAGISSYVTKGSDLQELFAAVHGEDVIPEPACETPLLDRGMAAAVA